MEASKRAARKFLAELKVINPPAYALLVNNGSALAPGSALLPTSMSAMGFVGAGDWNNTVDTASDPGFWSQVGSVLSQSVNLAIEKEQARQAAKVAEQRARAILAEENARLELMQQQRQTAIQTMELQREQAGISQAFKDLDFSKYQQVGLWVAGGLGLFLVR